MREGQIASTLDQTIAVKKVRLNSFKDPNMTSYAQFNTGNLEIDFQENIGGNIIDTSINKYLQPGCPILSNEKNIKPENVQILRIKDLLFPIIKPFCENCLKNDRHNFDKCINNSMLDFLTQTRISMFDTLEQIENQPNHEVFAACINSGTKALRGIEDSMIYK